MQTVEQVMTSRNDSGEYTDFLKTGGQDVRFRVKGEGPPLLMINGIGAPLEFWRPLEDELGDFQTITVDAPGSGRSKAPRGRFRMSDFAQVMDELLAHLAIDSANVIGLSLGGMIAQELAHSRPQRVERLILASTSAGLGSVPVPLRSWAAIMSPRRFYSSDHLREIAPVIYGDGVDADPVLLDEHLQIRKTCKPSVRGHYVQLRAATAWSSRLWLRRLEMPVLVIAGDADRLIPLANARMLANGVRDGRLEVFEGGSHLCTLQDPVRASRLIAGFIEQT